MKVKVCGMRNEQNIRELAKLPIDWMGFIFSSSSPRSAMMLDPSALRVVPDSIHRAGVFVNADFDDIMQRVVQFRLHTVQLHGEELPALCQRLKDEGIEVIKAFSAPQDVNFGFTAAYEPHCHYFLFDTPSTMRGGSGLQYNWSVLEGYSGSLPFLLSGGISPGDAARIVQFRHSRFAGIDINSRFETAPGEKEIEKIRLFLQNVQR